MPRRGVVFHPPSAAAKLAVTAMRLPSVTAGRLPAAWLSLALLSSCGGNRPADRSEAPRMAIQATRQEEGYLIEEVGEGAARPVLFYRLAPKSLNGEYARSNYIHPLYGLDGEILTEDFPEDHLHHRGVFWTWHQVLVGGVRAGDPWLAKNFSWDVRESAVFADGGGVRVRLHWKSPDFRGGAEAIVEEITAVRVHPAEGGLRKVDFEIRLTPLHDDFRLGGSEDDKGYGGFLAAPQDVGRPDVRRGERPGYSRTQRRGRRRMDGFFRNFRRRRGEKRRRRPGASVVGRLPSTLDYPRAADEEHAEPRLAGRGPLPLAKGEEVVLRYRLILHRGGADALPLAALWDEYRSADPRETGSFHPPDHLPGAGLTEEDVMDVFAAAGLQKPDFFGSVQ